MTAPAPAKYPGYRRLRNPGFQVEKTDPDRVKKGRDHAIWPLRNDRTILNWPMRCDWDDFHWPMKKTTTHSKLRKDNMLSTLTSGRAASYCVDQWGKITCFLHWPMGRRLQIVLTNLQIVLTNEERQNDFYTDQWEGRAATDCVDQWEKIKCFLHWPIGGRLQIVLSNEESHHRYFLHWPMGWRPQIVLPSFLR